MRNIIYSICLIAALGAIVTGCAILQSDNQEKKVRAFMASFEQSLAKGDDDCLKHFDSEQSRETLLAVVDILQNQDAALVTCQADFNNLEVEFADDRIIVKLVVDFIGTNAQRQDDVALVFWLKRTVTSFAIAQVFGDSFYSMFTNLKHDIQYASHIEEVVKDRAEIYEIANKLKPQFDSIVWYAQYQGKLYFYVVSGSWNALDEKRTTGSYKMGLVDETGKVIIPIEFDMVGTLGVNGLEGAEVKADEGFGFYDLVGNQLVPPKYDFILPYGKDFWLVRTFGQFGWLSGDTTFHAGFHDPETAKLLKTYGYVPSEMTINAENYSLCEVLHEDFVGSGTFISPSYFVALDMMPLLQAGFTTASSEAPIGGWTEYTTVNQSLFEQITETVGLLVVGFKERYLEGRSEFYETNKIAFVDSLQNKILTEELGGDETRLKRIGDDMIELATISHSTDMMNGAPLTYINYNYYQILGPGNIGKLVPKRQNPEIEFVKLDSSYMTGSYSVFNDQMGDYRTVDFMPIEDLQALRNQILAHNGYRIPDESMHKYYLTFNWYNPKYNTEEALDGVLNDIDRHNLRFLARMIELQQQPDGDV